MLSAERKTELLIKLAETQLKFRRIERDMRRLDRPKKVSTLDTTWDEAKAAGKGREATDDHAGRRGTFDTSKVVVPMPNPPLLSKSSRSFQPETYPLSERVRITPKIKPVPKATKSPSGAVELRNYDPGRAEFSRAGTLGHLSTGPTNLKTFRPKAPFYPPDWPKKQEARPKASGPQRISIPKGTKPIKI